MDTVRMATEAFRRGVAGNGFVDLGELGEVYIIPWAASDPSTWGFLLQNISGCTLEQALEAIGAFSKTATAPLMVQSTRFSSPAHEWSAQVKLDYEKEGGPGYDPNQDNQNLLIIEDEDQRDRDGRWLEVFLWFVLAALASGGCMKQLLIPGLGLSPMQRAEEALANLVGLRIDRIVLTPTEVREKGLTQESRDDETVMAGIKSLEKEIKQLRTKMKAMKTKETVDPKFFKAVSIDDIMTGLVQKLGAPDADVVEKAVGEITRRSVSAANKVKFADAGAIPPLVSLLSNGTPVAKENAAAALWSLAVNAANQETIAKAGAIPPLVSLLSNGTPVAKENAAAALRSLAVNDANEVAIVKAGAIGPLVALVKEGTPPQRLAATNALKNLSYAPGHKELLANAGYVP